MPHNRLPAETLFTEPLQDLSRPSPQRFPSEDLSQLQPLSGNPELTPHVQGKA